MSQTDDRCRAFVSWWDGEYEGWCVLPRDHGGDHWDGLSWYDDTGESKDAEDGHETRRGDSRNQRPGGEYPGQPPLRCELIDPFGGIADDR